MTTAVKYQLPSLEAVEAELCRRDLHRFVEKTWPLIEPMIPFQSNWHIKEICSILMRVTKGELQRALTSIYSDTLKPLEQRLREAKHIEAVLSGIEGEPLSRVIINVPPGTMKSLLVSVFWCAWEWATLPSLKYLTASYSNHLTLRDNRRVRTIVTSEWYQQHYNFALLGDATAVEKYITHAQGNRLATSVGGLGTGEHPDRIIIDDPITAQQARSDVERGNANTWSSNTMSSRGIGRNVAIIVIMQRLHEDDLTGYLLGKGGWYHVYFPMRYMRTRPPTEGDKGYTAHPSDPRTQAGELLWASLLDETKVRQLEIDLGPYDAAGQLQQQPVPEGGGLFKREWFKFVDVAPAKLRLCRGWDTAATEDGGDETSGTKMGMAPNNDIYVIHCVAEQIGPAGVDALIKSTAEADGRSCMVREEKEPGSAGVAVISARTTLLIGFDYAGVTITGDKTTRAKPFRAQVESGNVYLVRGDWNHEYISELCSFPTGKKDNRVDSSSCAFNALVADKSDSTVVW